MNTEQFKQKTLPIIKRCEKDNDHYLMVHFNGEEKVVTINSNMPFDQIFLVTNLIFEQKRKEENNKKVK